MTNGSRPGYKLNKQNTRSFCRDGVANITALWLMMIDIAYRGEAPVGNIFLGGGTWQSRKYI